MVNTLGGDKGSHAVALLVCSPANQSHQANHSLEFQSSLIFRCGVGRSPQEDGTLVPSGNQEGEDEFEAVGDGLVMLVDWGSGRLRGAQAEAWGDAMIKERLPCPWSRTRARRTR